MFVKTGDSLVNCVSLEYCQSVENADVAFVKRANEGNEFFKKKSKQSCMTNMFKRKG